MSTVNQRQTYAADVGPLSKTDECVPNGSVSVRVVRTLGELEDIREIWSAFQQHPNVDIDFYMLLCGVRSEILRPHVIVLYRGGQPEAMLVGRLVQGTIDSSIGYGKYPEDASSGVGGSVRGTARQRDF